MRLLHFGRLARTFSVKQVFRTGGAGGTIQWKLPLWACGSLGTDGLEQVPCNKGFASSSPTMSSNNDKDDNLGPEYIFQDQMVWPLPPDVLASANPGLAEAVRHDRELTRKAAVERISKIVLDRNPSWQNATILAALHMLKPSELQQELQHCGLVTVGDEETMIGRLAEFLEVEEIENSGRRQRRDQMMEDELEQLQSEPLSKFDFVHVVSPDKVVKIMADAHATDICIIDVTKSARFADYFVLANGRSLRHLHALAASVLSEVKQSCQRKNISHVAEGVTPGIEGEMGCDWVVVDAGSVVVHVFMEDARRYYDLEGLWGTEDNIRRITTDKMVETLDTIKVVDEDNR
ncbi:unnamed protein product [Ostreobium quekettii]|uniref:SAP domain-containing protein n=1 Tax=Ostreobium quekettii TaxID=121088 RepID=A0A8S1J2M6_9CHLO|nr:unnamed protein product [Ostreobium quekettii]|eukprot:evm.model.scf_27.3 EVM.evm.TU.scf_27.3   scf_27:19529-22654(+)